MSLCSIKSAETRKEKILQNGKDVGMAQKGQKQERMSCGEVFAVWFPHTRILHHIPTSGITTMDRAVLCALGL